MKVKNKEENATMGEGGRKAWRAVAALLFAHRGADASLAPHRVGRRQAAGTGQQRFRLSSPRAPLDHWAPALCTSFPPPPSQSVSCQHLKKFWVIWASLWFLCKKLLEMGQPTFYW